LRPHTLSPVTLRTVLAGATSAFGLSAIAASLPAKNRLEDIQIGESGAIVRVALLCRGLCDIAPSADPAAAGSFLVAGVTERLDLDLSGRGGLANRLRLSPVDGGSLLTIEADAGLNAAQVIACNTESGPARCVEFRFDHAGRTAAAPQPLPIKPAPVTIAPPKFAPKPAAAPTNVSAPEIRAALPANTAKDAVPFIGAVVLGAQSGLRDPADARFETPGFAPPERLAPPGPVRAPQTALALAASTLPASTLRERIAAPASQPGPGPQQRFSLAREMATILGKTADAGTCEGAAARLSADAWALQSMVDLAFCKAAAGSLDEADADLTRLLAYTPDNHEALVGRGLIAFARGERERGLDFLQEALNALPPIAESDRIAAAMGR
jgi:hypothetical protein